MLEPRVDTCHQQIHHVSLIYRLPGYGNELGNAARGLVSMSNLKVTAPGSSSTIPRSRSDLLYLAERSSCSAHCPLECDGRRILDCVSTDNRWQVESSRSPDLYCSVVRTTVCLRKPLNAVRYRLGVTLIWSYRREDAFCNVERQPGRKVTSTPIFRQLNEAVVSGRRHDSNLSSGHNDMATRASNIPLLRVRNHRDGTS